MSYTDVYWARLNHRGRTHKEREYYYGLKDFEKYLAEHPSSTNVLIDEVPTLASIISNRQDQFELTKKILTSIDTAIGPGSMVQWDDEHWIVYQRVRQPNETYTSCYMTRCNNKIVWIDDYGVKRERYCYIVSSEDSKIKANFRTWNGMITPQPNQHLELLIPTDATVRLGQKFIINERAWFVVEYDKISAPGITYYSLTEDKVDRMDDDVEQALVGYAKEGKATIEISDITVGVGEASMINPILYNEGRIEKATYIYDYDAAKVIIEGDVITGVAAGDTEVTIHVADSPDLQATITVHVEQTTGIVYSLEGPLSIRISETVKYIAYATSIEKDIDPILTFTLSNDLVKAKLSDGILFITANEDNKIGPVILTVNTANKEYVKELTIKSLW